MEATFKFRPLKFSWVALHPRPIGVIQFIGGAFFGTFPTLFYRYLLRQLFDQGYTIIASPFRFSFRHWSVAIGLVRDQSELRGAILEEAKRLGYEYQIYEEEPTSEQPNYFWIGHSLGNKYIALLELLSDLETMDAESIKRVLGGCVGNDQAQEIQRSLSDVDLKDISLKNQPYVLIAPAITGIESAIPFPPLANLVKRLGLDVKPNVEQTYCLIENSNLFHLISLVAFNQDNIAKETVAWLRTNLADKLVESAELPGRHLKPLGFRNGDAQLANKVIEFLGNLSQKLEKIFSG